jgi:hypothetical protein
VQRSGCGVLLATRNLAEAEEFATVSLSSITAS